MLSSEPDYFNIGHAIVNSTDIISIIQGEEVDPVNAIEAVLKQYPGGQILSEGLQNADDAGAKKFSLLLDKRCHPCKAMREHGELGKGKARSSLKGD